MKISKVKIESVSPDPNNARKHSVKNLDSIKGSLRKFGQQKPIVVDEKGIILAGNGTREAALELGWTHIHIIRTTLKGWEAAAYAVADNRTSELAEWDMDYLKQHLEAFENEFDVSEIGFSDDDLSKMFNEDKGSGSGPYDDFDKGSLSSRFGVPPFSILDGRAGYWQDRKRHWRSIILDFGESRQGTLADKENIMGGINDGVSLLDPVLAELTVKWFSNPGYKCLDPFAGDTVFGYVADHLGRSFTGIELREEQAKLNQERVPAAKYVCDDGQNVGKHIKAASQDLVFSCPPYFDLEVYSDLPNDASNQDIGGYRKIVTNALTAAFKCLKADRFAVIVIGDVRDNTGKYLQLDVLFKNIAEHAGLILYNEFILIDPIGTAALRATRLFNASRKHIKTHQNVLVFYKGATTNIKENFPPLEDCGFDGMEEEKEGGG